MQALTDIYLVICLLVKTETFFLTLERLQLLEVNFDSIS